MDILKGTYKELRAREIKIKEEIRKAKKMPTLEVIIWLDEVKKLRNRAKNIEESFEYKDSRYISNYHLRFSAKMLAEKMDKLRWACDFPDGVTVPIKVYVDQCPDRSQLLGTIWESLMDRHVWITSIYGSGGIGKTTAMRKIRNQLSTTETFDSIFWVSVSSDFSLYNVQKDIAQQMKLVLPRFDPWRTRRLRESLQKVGKFLIIFDDLREVIPLMEVGIPPRNRESTCKIVLISRDFDVCRDMRADKFIRVDPFSWTEKWNLFVEKAGDAVCAPEIIPLARQVVEMCPGFPSIVTSIGHAMRDETSVEAWRDVLVQLSTGTIGGFKSLHEIEGMGFKLLRICFTRLKNEIMQNCFLYCAFFPQEHLFKSEELIRYWIGESFIQQDGDFVTQIDAGSKIIRKLVDSNMLEMSTESGDDRLKMPHCCRNMAIKIMKEEPRFWLNADQRSRKRGCDLKQPRKVSLIINSKDPFLMWEWSPVYVSTLLMCHSSITYLDQVYFGYSHALRFLDLSHSDIEVFPTPTCSLAQLRVLLLQNCRNLKTIPTLETMEELEILNLQGTSITEMPQGMERMVRLRSLDLTDTTKLENMRVGLISSLSGLEELRMQGSGVCKMDSPMVANYLMEMRSLRRLAILTISTIRYSDLLRTITCLRGQNLQIYSINLYGSTDDYNEDVCDPIV